LLQALAELSSRQTYAGWSEFQQDASYWRPRRISNAIGFAKFFSRSHQAVIRVYDEVGNVIETHEHAGDFKES